MQAFFYAKITFLKKLKSLRCFYFFFISLLCQKPVKRM